MPVTSAAQQRRALTGRFTFAVGNAHNLGGIDVNQARIDHHDGLALLVAEAANAEAAPSAASAADVGVLVVVAELRHAADNDGVNAQQAADLGGRVRIGAIAVGEVLFGEDLVHRLALDDGVRAVLHQVAHEQIGDALADIDIGAENSGAAALDGGEIEVEDGDAL